MSATSTRPVQGPNPFLMWGILILSVTNIWLDRRWPGSAAHTLSFYAMMACFLISFGSQIVMGYRRRRPHWSRDSWQRYLRLISMPALALVLLFVELYFFDPKGRGLFGAPHSTLRVAWIAIDLALMAFGVVGMSAALEWLRRGEPSEPFTRTRWFQRRATAIPRNSN